MRATGGSALGAASPRGRGHTPTVGYATPTRRREMGRGGGGGGAMQWLGQWLRLVTTRREAGAAPSERAGRGSWAGRAGETDGRSARRPPTSHPPSLTGRPSWHGAPRRLAASGSARQVIRILCIKGDQ